ncbi:MAG: uncharacterized protein A8A55_3424, partial [Amphiamblys sp. WSBS2006]
LDLRRQRGSIQVPVSSEQDLTFPIDKLLDGFPHVLHCSGLLVARNVNTLDNKLPEEALGFSEAEVRPLCSDLLDRQTAPHRDGYAYFPRRVLCWLTDHLEAWDPEFPLFHQSLME